MTLNDNLEERKKRLIERYKKNGYLDSPNVIRAFKKVPREEFIGNNPKKYAYADRPLPILDNQTISAPHMVAMMVSKKLLDYQVGDKCLEVGGGSGYHAAVIAEIVAPSNVPKEKWGHVYTVERLPSLVAFAKGNLESAGYDERVTVIEGDGSEGYSEEAPYDKITVACAAPKIPPPLIEQLKPTGKLVIPVGGRSFMQNLVVLTKDKEGKTHKESISGVAFVPLVGKYGF
ncbi:MAG: protein-L-isoaspartate(D-aspartate) O-methyltransferase [Asgard group archaeon]|nr:protein-L-isoaspartate(D-aspartate) O-methyltransferase [Asgard group archaeon]